MKVLFNSMISSNKAQNVSCKATSKKTNEVRETEEYLGKFLKNQKVKKQHSVNTSKYKNSCYKGIFKGKSTSLTKKISAFIKDRASKHSIEQSLFAFLIVVGIMPLMAKSINMYFQKLDVKEYAPDEAKRISQITDKKQRTIAWQEAADSIKVANYYKPHKEIDVDIFMSNTDGQNKLK